MSHRRDKLLQVAADVALAVILGVGFAALFFYQLSGGF